MYIAISYGICVTINKFFKTNLNLMYKTNFSPTACFLTQIMLMSHLQNLVSY